MMPFGDSGSSQLKTTEVGLSAVALKLGTEEGTVVDMEDRTITTLCITSTYVKLTSIYFTAFCNTQFQYETTPCRTNHLLEW